MSTPLKVLICWVAIAVSLVVVVFYRYHLIEGIQKSFHTDSPAAPASSSTKVEAAPPVQKPAAVLANLTNGKKLFEEKTCVLCHGANGKADTPTGLAMKATDLTAGVFTHNAEKLEATAYILKVIENGVPGTAMVSFKLQIPSEQDRKDLADYVHSLSQK
ncbi:MAG: cytochrome c [Bdellovibrionota bacterium]